MNYITSTIKRADGTEPFNDYLWPTESWWASRDVRANFDRWNFGIIALNDGRFAIEGSVYRIEQNKGIYYDRPIVFGCRVKAIRIAAARMLTVAKASRYWANSMDALKNSEFAEVFNWARRIVAKESKRKTPKPIRLKDRPKSAQTVGLPLFDFQA